MDLSQSADPPHPDIRLAFIDDVQRIRNFEHEPPTGLAELITSDSWLAHMARDLVETVGSVDALETLTAEPLPAEATDFTECDPDDAELGSDLLARINCAGLDLDAELTTIVGRIVKQLITHPEQPLHRKARRQRIAAAIAWIALKTNGQLERRSRFNATDLWFAFEVSNASDIARSLQQKLFEANRTWVRPIGHFHTGPQRPLLADPGLLHSKYRRELVAQRNDLKERVRLDQQAALEHHPIQPRHGQISFACQPTTVRWAQRTETSEGRSTIMIGLDDLEPMTLLSISIPDARRLITALQHALSQPATHAA